MKHPSESTAEEVFPWKWINVTEEMEKMSEETRVKNETTGGEKGSKLCRMDLIPAGPLMELGEHFGKGCAKYAARNWERGYAWSLSFAAAQRHAWQFWNGENRDPETGSKHAIAAAWHWLAIAEFMETHPELDDRPNSEPNSPPAPPPLPPKGWKFKAGYPPLEDLDLSKDTVRTARMKFRALEYARMRNCGMDIPVDPNAYAPTAPEEIAWAHSGSVPLPPGPKQPVFVKGERLRHGPTGALVHVEQMVGPDHSGFIDSRMNQIHT